MAIKLGDKVRVVNPVYTSSFNGYNIGDIFEVKTVLSESITTVDGPNLWHREYVKATKGERLCYAEQAVTTLRRETKRLDKYAEGLRRNLTEASKQIEALVQRVEALEGSSASTGYAPVTTDNITEGDIIRVINADDVDCATLTNGECYMITNVYYDGDFDIIDDDGDDIMITSSEFHAIEKVVSG